MATDMVDKAAESANRGGRLELLFAALAFIACNGTFVLVAALSVIGLSISINPHIQAAAISLFAVLSLLLVYRQFRRHHARGPLLLSAAATAVLIGTMYLYFDKIIESVGLLALVGAALWSWRSCRHHCAPANAANRQRTEH
jgi:phosphoglycerol transferase MdoB-like AlkP superfamily enzyme